MADELGHPLEFQLDYSLDGGATWLPASPDPAVKVFASRYTVLVVPEEAAPTQEFQELGRVRPLMKGRIYVTLEIQARDQTNGGTSEANALLAWLDDYRRKPLLRISHASGVTIDGRSFFASATNTYWLVQDGTGEEPDIVSAFFKSITLKLKSRDWID